MVDLFFSFSLLHFYLQQSSSTNSIGNANSSLSSAHGDHSSKTDGTQSTGSGSTTQHSSYIITNQSPYQLSYHHNNHHHHHHGSRSYHRGSGRPRNEPLPINPTGIPRDTLIPIPRPIPGSFRGQTGVSVVPLQMA